MTKPSVGQERESQELSHTVGVAVNCYTHLRDNSLLSNQLGEVHSLWPSHSTPRYDS